MVRDNGWLDADTATFGDRLAVAREAAGLTQTALASKIGVKLPVIAGWEEDRNYPRANRLQMLSGLLGVSITWLLTGDGEGPDASEDEEILSDEVLDLLARVRALRGEISQIGDNLARVEKRLRKALKQPS